MKRSWIGAGLLAVLLAAGILSSQWMQRHHSSLSRMISQAQHQAAGDNWPQAEKLTRSAQEIWEDRWGISASLTEHAPMELVDSLFAQLEVCIQTRDADAAQVLCAQLAKELDAIGDEHAFTWWNLL